MTIRSAIDGFRGDLRGRAFVVVIGCLICQMGLGFGYVFGPLAKDIIDELGWTRADFSLTRTLQLAAMALASPLIGLLVVRHGAKIVLTAGTLAVSLVFFLLSRMDGLYEYWALMVAFGVALTALGDVTVGQTVSQWVTRGRGLALGLVFVGSNIGGVLMVPVTSMIAEGAGWRTAMTRLSVLTAVLLLPAALFLVRDRGEIVSDAVVRADEPGARAPRVDMGLAAAARTRSFWILLFSLFTFFFYFLALLEHLVLHLTDEGMEQSDAVALYSTAIGLGIVSKLLLGGIADRISERSAVLVVYCGLTLSSLLLLVGSTPALMWIFALTFGFSYAARDVIHPLIVTWCFGLRNMASIYGTLMLTLVLGGTGPFFAAAVHDQTGSYRIAFVVFAGLNVLSVLSLLFLRVEGDGRVEASALSRPT